MRVLPVTPSAENVGLRRVGLKRSETDPTAWQVFVAARNYGPSARTVPLELRFGGALVGVRPLMLNPGADQEETFQLRTRAAGLLEARLVANDSLPEDDRATIELPEQRSLKIVAFTWPSSIRSHRQ